MSEYEPYNPEKYGGSPEPPKPRENPKGEHKQLKAKKTLNKIIKIIIIGVIVAIVIIALAVLLFNISKGGGHSEPPDDHGVHYSETMKKEDMDCYRVDVVDQKRGRELIIDGKTITLSEPLYYIDEYHYISLRDWADLFGFTYSFNPWLNRAFLTKEKTVYQFERDTYHVVLNPKGDAEIINSAYPIMLGTNFPGPGPEQDEDADYDTYMRIANLKSVFELKSLDWDETKEVLTILISTGSNLSLEKEESDPPDVVIVGEPGPGPGGPPPDFNNPAPPPNGMPSQQNPQYNGQSTETGRTTSSGQKGQQ